MKRKILALMLTASLAAAALTGCGSDSSGTGSDTSAAGNTGAETGSAEADLKESELVTLDVVMMSSGKNEPDITEVENAMNEILEEKFNVNVNLTFIAYASYAEQISLMLSSGEGADLLAVYLTPLPTCASAGQIIPLDDLLDQYGQGIYEQLGDYIECGRVGDSIYGVTTNRDLANSQGFAYRKDIADEVGFDADSIETLDDLERELLKVKEAYPDMWPVAVSAGENIRNWGWDPLGDDTVNLGVLSDMAQEPTVVNLYETDQYKDLANTMYSWMQEGLIQADAVNTTEVATTLMTAKTAFGYFTNLKPGFAEETSSSLGYEIGVVDIIDALGCTNNVSRATWTISSGCDHPEAAMKVLNELFTNPDLSNLYMYGIKGTHYKVLEEGGASNGQSIITWADGLDASTSNYRKSATWLAPNQFIGHVWEGSAPDVWDQQRAFNNDALKSVAFGFTYDSSAVTNEVAACTNVVAKYHNALLCGALEPESTLEQFNQELYAAGLQNIIDEKQRQLDEWLAAYGN
ncbi:MAG: ABC transporter substrate-binding protein [Eubacteriales bacterium]|nr:ABC transporter substrate-binding protein [Eubacteriales bacterium]